MHKGDDQDCKVLSVLMRHLNILKYFSFGIESQFKKALQQLIRPKKRHLFGINDRVGVNLLTRLRVDFSLLCIFSCTASYILI